jgi:general secretion pathway protein F
VLFLNKQAKLRKQISNALIYPGILAAFAFCVIILLMGFVVPSMEGIFEGRTLNGFTELVLGISRFLRSHWFLLIVLLGGSAFGLYTYLRRPKGQQDLERLLMKMPLIKTLLIEAALVRFTRTLSTLLEGGLPLIDGLKLSAGVMQNHLMQEEVKRAENRVLEGGRLKDEFRRSRYLPQMAVRMMAIGEESGHLSEMLKKVADIYEEDLEKTIERTMSLAQPCILIIMGAIIGLVLLAILLPMTDLSSLTET